jgi:ATP-dependent DNA helicase RecQ
MKQRLDILRGKFGFQDFREGQEEIMDALLAGQDVVAVMPTGSGKSLCYQLPALLLEGVTLVISPLIALMKDQVDALEQNRIPATFINSSLTPQEQRQRLGRVRQGEIKLLYVAPERFRNASFAAGLQPCQVSLFAVDEAHCVSEWGHDFRPDYLRLKEVIERLGHPPVVALTATATPEVREDVVVQLGLKEPLRLVTGFDRPNLHLSVQDVSGELEKMEALREKLNHLPGAAGIIYAATRKSVDEITRTLKAGGYRVAGYHAGMLADARKQVQERFMSGEVPVVAATNAFGMGIDKSDLRFICHYQLPGSLEAYYQEIGRAGRDGKPADCLLLFNFADTYTQEFFIENSYPPRQVVKEVYQLLCRFTEDEIEVPLKELGRQLPTEKVSEMMVASALKLLDKAGHIERGTLGEGTARLTLQTPAAELGHASFRGKLQQVVIEHFVYGLEAEKERTIQFDLEETAGRLGLEPEQVRRTLASLEEAGHLTYTPPFRGRGIRILDRVDSSKLRIDFAEVERRAAFERRKLRLMVDYAYSRQCLRHFILSYFGERHTRSHCGNCSCCHAGHSPQASRALTGGETLIVRKALSGVARMGGRFGKFRVAQMLTGSRQKTLLGLGLDRLSTYGILKEFSQAEVMTLLDALVECGHLIIEGAEYPLVKLTESGRQAMLEKEPVQMEFPLELAPPPPPQIPARRKSEEVSLPFHKELYEELRKWRLDLVVEMNLPAFMILPDRTLRQIARLLPSSGTDLARVPGIGPQKLAQYGKEILAVVSSFCQRCAVARPYSGSAEPLGVAEKQTGKKPATQGRSPASNVPHQGLPATLEVTWKWWQQGKTVEEIAELRELARGTVVDHLVELSQKGRNVNLDGLVSPQHREQIESVLRQTSSGGLKAVKEALPPEISYDEIRLVAAAFRQTHKPKGAIH